jgi:hypothetical protein
MRGVVARTSKKYVFSYFFLPKYENISDAVIDDFLTPVNSILIQRYHNSSLFEHNNSLFDECKWKIIGKISPWSRDVWKLPVFGHIEEIFKKWGELRYYDEGNLDIFSSTKRVPIEEFLTIQESLPVYIYTLHDGTDRIELVNYPSDGTVCFKALEDELEIMLVRYPAFCHSKLPPELRHAQDLKMIEEYAQWRAKVKEMRTKRKEAREKAKEVKAKEYAQSPKDSISFLDTNKSQEGVVKKRWTTNPIKKPLQRILNRLDIIAQRHGEVSDTDVRDVLHSVVWDGFIEMKKEYSLPEDFDMFSKSGNKKVYIAMKKFLESVRILVSEIPVLNSRQSRFEAFQDIEIQSKEGSTYDDYFGYCEEC